MAAAATLTTRPRSTCQTVCFRRQMATEWIICWRPLGDFYSPGFPSKSLAWLRTVSRQCLRVWRCLLGAFRLRRARRTRKDHMWTCQQVAPSCIEYRSFQYYLVLSIYITLVTHVNLLDFEMRLARSSDRPRGSALSGGHSHASLAGSERIPALIWGLGGTYTAASWITRRCSPTSRLGSDSARWKACR